MSENGRRQAIGNNNKHKVISRNIYFFIIKWCPWRAHFLACFWHNIIPKIAILAYHYFGAGIEVQCARIAGGRESREIIYWQEIPFRISENTKLLCRLWRNCCLWVTKGIILWAHFFNKWHTQNGLGSRERKQWPSPKKLRDTHNEKVLKKYECFSIFDNSLIG